MKLTTNCKAGVVDGSYYFSCEGIAETPQSDGSTYLACFCQTSGDRYVPSALLVPAGYDGNVANCNGTLKLGSCSPPNKLPLQR